MEEPHIQEKGESIEIRSEEVQEIISRVPSWIIRWGITVIFAVFIVLLLISWFVKYPDIIRAQGVLTTSPAVMTLISRNSGNLILLKQENTPLREGEHVAYLMSNTSLENVLSLEKFLSNLPALESAVTFPNELRLGELQSPYNDFLNAAENLVNYYTLDPSGIQLAQLRQQLTVHARLREILLEQSALSEEESGLAHNRYKMDSTLFAKELIPAAEHINAKASYLQTIRSHRSMETTLANENIQIQTLKTQIAELELRQKEKLSNFTLTYANTLRILKMRIDQWKETNVFISPSAGKLAYLGFLENKMFIEAGKPLFSIVPETGHIYAQAEIPVIGSGKIKQGQQVNIRLYNYPSEQYGILYGKVKDISIVPNDNKYLAKIELNNSLTTSHNLQLPFKQHLQGDVEIITEDLRLLERVFYQFKKLLQFTD